MAFNISQFSTSITKSGVQRNSYFEVIFTPPPIMTGLSIPNRPSFLETTKLMKFRTNQATIPGVGIKTLPVNKYGTGQWTKYPIAGAYTDVNFSLLLDKKGDIYDFWYSWLNLVANFVQSNEFFSVRTRENIVNFKDDYSTSVQIIRYDEAGNITKICVLEKAFPITMNDLNLSYEDNRFSLHNISLTYDRWYLDNHSVSTNDSNKKGDPTKWVI